MISIKTVLCTLLIALLVSGCGGDEKSTKSPVQPPAQSTANQIGNGVAIKVNQNAPLDVLDVSVKKYAKPVNGKNYLIPCITMKLKNIAKEDVSLYIHNFHLQKEGQNSFSAGGNQFARSGFTKIPGVEKLDMSMKLLPGDTCTAVLCFQTDILDGNVAGWTVYFQDLAAKRHALITLQPEKQNNTGEKTVSLLPQEEYKLLRQDVVQKYEAIVNSDTAWREQYGDKTFDKLFKGKTPKEQAAILDGRISLLKKARTDDIEPLIQKMEALSKNDAELAKDLAMVKGLINRSIQGHIDNYLVTRRTFERMWAASSELNNTVDNSAKQVPAKSNIEVSASTPVEALVKFHHAITKKDFKVAYQFLGPEMQKYVGGYDKFVQGYATTIQSVPAKFNTVSSDSSNATMTYVIFAQDTSPSGTIKQEFSAESKFELINGLWRIVDTRAKKIR